MIIGYTSISACYGVAIGKCDWAAAADMAMSRAKADRYGVPPHQQQPGSTLALSPPNDARLVRVHDSGGFDSVAQHGVIAAAKGSTAGVVHNGNGTAVEFTMVEMVQWGDTGTVSSRVEERKHRL